MNEPKLIRVTMEFDDGKIQVLENNEANRWLKAINNMCVLEHVHGRPFPSFKWIIEAK